MMEENVWSKDEEKITQLEKKILELESQIGAINPRNLAGISQKTLRAATRANIFGDGSDEDIVLDGTTDFNDFSSRSGTTYTLSRDLFAGNLTLKSGVILKGNGYRIFVSKTLTNGGTIHANGNTGGAGQENQVSGGGIAGTAAHGAGSLPASLPGVAGGAGDNFTDPGVAGTNGTSVAKSLGAAGAGGGGGGSSAGAGGAGGNGGSKTGTVYNTPRSPQAAYYLIDTQPSDTVVTLKSSAVGGGGGGGGGGTGNGWRGGGGGGSGSPGGFLVIFAYRIVNNGVISADGGVGGAGASGGDQTDYPGENFAPGGGGGGAGGSGGVVILVYGIKSGSGTITASGAAGGLGGAGGVGLSATANSGLAGSAGNDGSIIEVIVG